MRVFPMLMMFACASANAATLEVSVATGSKEPQVYRYELKDERQTLDLRESGRYTVAVRDKVRGSNICREAEYRTGMVLTLRQVADDDSSSVNVEVIGQVSKLKSLEKGASLDCGQDMKPVFQTEGFSSVVQLGKPKMLVIDGSTTLLLTIME